MITAILLAAGESKRMNGENKLIKKNLWKTFDRTLSKKYTRKFN